MYNFFTASKLKIGRAYKHITDLNSLLSEFGKTDFCRLRVDVDPNTGYNTLKVESISPIPSDIPLIIGDIVHNLHSALDLVICEILINAGKTLDGTTKFPFFKFRQELIGQINSGKLKAVGRDIYELIIDTIKPYRGGNDALYGLHDLDILDKHRSLILVLSIVGVDGVCAEDENHNVFENCGIRVRHDRMSGLISTGSKLHIKSYGKPTLEIYFGQGQPFEKQSVISTVQQLAQLVQGIVQIIEQTYISRNT